MSVFILLLRREARLLFRRPAELANPLVFFAIVVALFPLAVGPESQLLQTLSPGRSSKARCSNSRRQSRSQARPAAWR